MERVSNNTSVSICFLGICVNLIIDSYIDDFVHI